MAKRCWPGSEATNLKHFERNNNGEKEGRFISMNQRRRLNRPSVVARVPIRSSRPLFPGFHQTFICITIPPTSMAGNSSMRNANHIFSRQGFTPCFNFPRAHQGNIRPASRRAAFTEQIRPQPLWSSSNLQPLCISSSQPLRTLSNLLPMYKPPTWVPLQELPHPVLASSGVVLQSNRGTGMCLPVLATVTVWTSHPAPPPPRFLLHPNTLKSLDTDQRQTGNVQISFWQQSRINDWVLETWARRPRARWDISQRCTDVIIEELVDLLSIHRVLFPPVPINQSRPALARRPNAASFVNGKWRQLRRRYISYEQRDSQCIAKRLFPFLHSHSTQVTSLHAA